MIMGTLPSSGVFFLKRLNIFMVEVFCFLGKIYSQVVCVLLCIELSPFSIWFS